MHCYSLLTLLAGATLATAIPATAKEPTPTPAKVLSDMKRVADWQIANPSRHRVSDWTQAPFFIGLTNLHQVSGEKRYLDVVTGFGKQINFGPGKRVYHADDHAVLQAWLDLYTLQPDQKQRLQPSIDHFPKLLKVLSKKQPASVSGGTFTWCWCDALFMSPPVWAQLSSLTKDPKYLEWADREWWTTTDVLYDPEAHLYYRDNKYFKKRTETGRKIFWARGNGWVIGGLVRMLDYLPADHPSRGKYLALYHDMMHALLKLQNPDGLWRTSLLDPEGNIGESSGTSFFVYGMAWGVNRGLLPADTFQPAVIKGWNALCQNIQATGMLGYVQKIGEAPGGAGPRSTEVYGSGAFLLAGAEIIRGLDPSKQKKGLTSYQGAKIKAPFLNAKPRVVARFVPERSDDFAWENDLIAFRTYGAALRSGTEDSGFDAWLKRVPSPVVDKWYLEDAKVLPYGNVNKSYHHDHGEGYDGYKVGNTRGCGGIALWTDGKLHNSNTFVGYKVIEQSPERAIFDLYYTSKFQGKLLRESKRITIIMGQRLFQCESRFTLDGKPASFHVAIGLNPQDKQSKAAFSPRQGKMLLWENLDGLGFGQGIIVDPASVSKMINHTDAKGQQQALCIAKTDDTGYIRWFSGYGWEGQGEITNAKLWTSYLDQFAATFLKTPFADHSQSLTVHQLPIPLDPLQPVPVKGVPGATRIKPNGGWCWYQGPRAIVTKNGKVLFTSIAGDTYAGHDAGDLWATSWDPNSGEVTHFELHNQFQRDDHNVAGLLEKPDGTILAVYGKHGSDRLQRWRHTTQPGDISSWTKEQSLNTGAAYTYSNVFRLSEENGKIYNFSRSIGYNPNCTISDDNGKSWKKGWRLLHWAKSDYKGDPNHTGVDGSRPYLRYASNNKDSIHFVTTEDHPRAYDNSIYHGYYSAGKLHNSTGSVLSQPASKDAKRLTPQSFTKVYQGGIDNVAWTVDLELDTKGLPYTVFSVQIDGKATRKQRYKNTCNDHRYWYARFDGKQWHSHEMAYAGTMLYSSESDYTGLVALDPDDPNTVVISTNADPVTGKALISNADQKRHWELYKGTTRNGGKTWQWTAITKNSDVDNLRPVIPSNPGGKRIILWGQGDLKSFTNYRLDICGITEERD
ncbi:glycoside hydrolase family 88 protein [Verrucomicrobiaceae bacterium N1E253]|uniref:Glycoside hydrolase family 88 protein n=1 Tax=Oceaniferula marina TaxID=2748318 RepID=A0A851GC83_9BACT|nr:glycoside hydrolase family 88 protein [Oceaniferula marina]NWK55036.1 glycoside hydrolase family 88 protein [Oceaniferula marina]